MQCFRHMRSTLQGNKISPSTPSPSSPLPVPQRNNGTSSVFPLPACSPPPHKSWLFSSLRYSNSIFSLLHFTPTPPPQPCLSCTYHRPHAQHTLSKSTRCSSCKSKCTHHPQSISHCRCHHRQNSHDAQFSSEAHYLLTHSSHHRSKTTHQGFAKATAPVSPGKRRHGRRDDWWYHVRSLHSFVKHEHLTDTLPVSAPPAPVRRE